MKKKLKILWGSFLCLIGKHDWENIDGYTPDPEPGTMVCYQNLHKCRRCGEERNLGMGCIM